MAGRGGFNPAPTNAKTWFDKLTTLSKIEGQRTLREYFKGAGCGDEQSRNELPRNKSARYQGIIRDYFSEVDRGREGLAPSPPSEPCMRFSRTRLSSRWFPQRDWLASARAATLVNSPLRSKESISYLPPMTPFPAPPTCARSTPRLTRPTPAVRICALSNPCGHSDASLSLCLVVALTHPPSYLPSLRAVLLSAPSADSSTTVSGRRRRALRRW